MGYRVCKSTGVIHACGNDFKKVCIRSRNITPGNYEDCRTKDGPKRLHEQRINRHVTVSIATLERRFSKN